MKDTSYVIAPAMKPVRLSVNRKQLAGTPRDRVVEGGDGLTLSWGVAHSRGLCQAEYAVRLECGGREVYSSGWIKSDRQEHTLGASDLKRGARIDMCVKVRDDAGCESSEACESFYLGDVEWNAPWVTSREDANHRTLYFRREFELKHGIKCATLYACGLGYHNAYINGARVGDAHLDPAHTDYSAVCQYVVDPEVEGMLKPGRNCIAFEVGGGWRDNPGQYTVLFRDATFFGDRRLTFMLDVEYADGTGERISSGEAVQCGFGPSVKSTLFNGEDYDANIDITGWKEVGFGGFEEVKLCGAPVGEMRPMLIPPIREKRVYKPLSISRMGESSIIDFGQNIAGVVRMKLPKLPQGTQITIAHSEELDENGDLYTAVLRGAEATDRYTFAGDGRDLSVWQPDFTYHGFRYARVTGFEPDMDGIEAVELHTDMQPAGFFVSGSAALNALHEQVLRTEEGNMHSILTDCPQRDERMGWMNDATVRFEETPYNFDCAGMFKKIVRDIMSVQHSDGAISCTVPKLYGSFPADPVCSSFLVAGWEAYAHFGDCETLTEAFDSFAAWENCLLAHSDDYIVNYSYYGDWAGPAYACEPNDGARSIVTPGIFMSTGYSYFNCKLLSRMAKALGREADEQHYTELAESIKRAMLAKWYDADNAAMCTGSMACQAFALWLGIVPEKDCARAAKKMHDELVNSGYQFTTGNLCTRYLLDELAEYGYIDDAYELLTRDEYPSWGFMRQNEATTVWERFELKKNPGMNSHNHPMYGAADAFLYSHILGIHALEAGMRRFEVKPYMPEKLLSAQGGLDTPYGRIGVRWFKRYGGTHLFIDVPFGCECEAELMGERKTLKAGSHHLFKAED